MLRPLRVPLAVLLLVGAPSLAEPSPAVHRALAQVAKPFRAGQYDKALKQVIRARKVAKTPEDQALCDLYDGQILATKGSDWEAVDAFKHALAVIPDASLPFSPKPAVDDAFKKAKAQFAAEKQPKPLEMPPPPAPLAEKPPPPALAPSPTPAKVLDQGPVKLAMPGISGVNMDQKTTDAYADYFAQHLAAAGGIRVTTRSEVSALLGFERQKQLLGCSDSSTSCLAEIAGALGVDGLVLGSIGKLGNEFVVTLKIVSASDGHAYASASWRSSDETALLDSLAKAARSMAHRVKVAMGRATGPEPLAEEETQTTGQARAKAWIPWVAGGGLVVAGGVFYGLAAQRASTLEHGVGTYSSLTQLDGAVSQGNTYQTVGVALIGTGLAAGLVGAGMYLFGGSTAPTVALAPTGSGVAFAGTF